MLSPSTKTNIETFHIKFKRKKIDRSKDFNEDNASPIDDDNEHSGGNDDATILVDDDSNILSLSKASTQLDLKNLPPYVDRSDHFLYYQSLQ